MKEKIMEGWALGEFLYLMKNWFLWGIDGADPSKNELDSNSTIKEIKNENSTISFEIDKELNITVHSRINKNVILTLIDQEYLSAKESEDEGAVQVAFVLIANEITEQIIEKINQNAEEFNN